MFYKQTYTEQAGYTDFSFQNYAVFFIWVDIRFMVYWSVEAHSGSLFLKVRQEIRTIG